VSPKIEGEIIWKAYKNENLFINWNRDASQFIENEINKSFKGSIKIFTIITIILFVGAGVVSFIPIFFTGIQSLSKILPICIAGISVFVIITFFNYKYNEANVILNAQKNAESNHINNLLK